MARRFLKDEFPGSSRMRDAARQKAGSWQDLEERYGSRRKKTPSSPESPGPPPNPRKYYKVVIDGKPMTMRGDEFCGVRPANLDLQETKPPLNPPLNPPLGIRIKDGIKDGLRDARQNVIQLVRRERSLG